MRKINMAVLGMGTVGSGVVEVLTKNGKLLEKRTGCEIILKKIVDKRKNELFPLLEKYGIDKEILSDDFQEILQDREIEIVVELIGGIDPAKNMISQLLVAGKSVVTANKDLIAAHGKELLTLADENEVDLLFEASVAGGIPIVQVLKESLAANAIQQMMGIVNGTTNYILTKMTQEGLDFAEVLKEAQSLGYAEADPTADVGGYDAARKAAILASVAFNSRVIDEQVYVEGITKIQKRDIECADELGYVIKLLMVAKEEDEEIEARVHPMMIRKNHPLANVNDAFNAVFVEGDAVGETMFYGQGAGSLPTASAVVGDVILAARNIKDGVQSRIGCTCFAEKKVKSISEVCSNFYLRAIVEDRPGVLANIAAILGNEGISIETVIQKNEANDGKAELVLVTHKIKEQNLNDALAILNGVSYIQSIENMIRVQD